MWDPAQYRRYASERSRPFFDLVGRVAARAPAVVADLGCGTGELTCALSERWPGADVLGLDSSPEMIEAARRLTGAGQVSAPDARPSLPRFELGDVSAWQPAGQVDVIVSNAVLQWVPRHTELIARWAGWLPPGGWLAFQVPGNFRQPSHQILLDLVESPRWRSEVAGAVQPRQTSDPADYVDLLARSGCEVDAWETTYLHMLPGDDPVLDWYRGSGLRPVIAVLPPERSAEFLAEYAERARQAYPRQPYGTVLPFRRVFVVARRR